MADWEDLRHFVVLAREGTLSAAARLLGVDHATVARRVAALEADTGLKLVDRRARSYQLTDDGRRIAATATPMEEAAFAVGRAVQAAKPGLRGEVSISSPPSLANALIAPQFRLRQRHPGIRIKLIGEKRAASLNRREADVALRLSRPQEAGLIARKIGSFGFGLYGAPAYLKQTSRHAFSFIAYDDGMDDAPQQKWLQAIAAGHEIVLPHQRSGESGRGGANGCWARGIAAVSCRSRPRARTLRRHACATEPQRVAAGSSRASPDTARARGDGVPDRLHRRQ